MFDEVVCDVICSVGIPFIVIIVAPDAIPDISMTSKLMIDIQYVRKNEKRM